MTEVEEKILFLPLEIVQNSIGFSFDVGREFLSICICTSLPISLKDHEVHYSCVFFQINISGSSLTKTIYRSKEDFTCGEPINSEVKC